MASLKALKIRIGSVKSTQKITKAMKTVAAAKLRRAQDAAVAGRPYAERLEAVMASLAGKVTISASSPRLLAGTGKSDTGTRPRRRLQHQHRSCRAPPGG
jgi:F-type H+-transporting ATPase subunit gamma